MRAWRAVAIGVLLFALLFCGAMIGLAVGLARELNKQKSQCRAPPPPASVVITSPSPSPPLRSSPPPAASPSPSPSASPLAAPAAPCTGRDVAANASFPPRVADVFTPFSQPELDQISAFVRSALTLQASEPEGLAGNWLYAIDFLPENKDTVLRHVDGGAAYAGRSARAVVYQLADPGSLAVVEYKVGPIPRFPIPPGTPIAPIQQGGSLGNATAIPYLMRPISAQEYALMEPVVVDAMTTLANLSTVSYGAPPPRIPR